MNSGIPFLSAHASAADWQIAAKEIVQQLDGVAAAHRLGFLYVTDHFSVYLDEISISLLNIKSKAVDKCWSQSVRAT